MLSPFPGMDPFLEGSGEWSDFHSCFPLAAKNLLAPQLPPGFVALAEKEVYIHEPTAEERGRLLGRTDGGVALAGGGSRRPTSRGAAVASPAAPPLRCRLPDVFEETVKRVVLKDRGSREVVTVIELLSPVHKIRHRDAYEQKRRACLDSEAHLVEVDLLRAGRRIPLQDPPESDYLVSVSRAEDRPVVDLWPFGVRDSMPTVPVPLRRGAFVMLDLRALLDAVWSVSDYEFLIYDAPPTPPLPARDAAWASEVLTDAGIPLPPGFPPPAPDPPA